MHAKLVTAAAGGSERVSFWSSADLLAVAAVSCMQCQLLKKCNGAALLNGYAETSDTQ
jgi:hypothetical protein